MRISDWSSDVCSSDLQTATLALESHGGHAAAVRDAAGLDGGAAGRATRLGVEREEGHPLVGQTVEIGCGHASAGPTSIGAEIAVAGVVRHEDRKSTRLNSSH